MNKKKQRLSKILVSICFILLIGYFLILFKVICLKYLGLADILPHFERTGFRRSYNLIPFATIKLYIIYDSMPMLRRLGNVFGNIALFVPIGLLLPLIFSWTRRFYRIILISFLLSVSMELFQYLWGTGAADIDDILLNVMGGLIGYMVYILLKTILKNEVKIILGALVIFLIMIFSGGWVAIREFNLDLGLINGNKERAKSSVITLPYDSTVVVPVRFADVEGTLENISGDTLMINAFQIIREEKTNNENGSTIMIISAANNSSNPLSKFIASENTYVLRKDVDQYSARKFEIEYSISRLDSIPTKCKNLAIWVSQTDSTHVDTLCFTITHVK